MPTKRCSCGTCNSDSRYKDKPRMEGITFFPFPKPWIDLEKCRSWLKACGRPLEQLNENKIAGHHYVCSKHFVDGHPTKEYPCPVSADPYTGTRVMKFRPVPKKRAAPSTSVTELPLKLSKKDDVCDTTNQNVSEEIISMEKTGSAQENEQMSNNKSAQTDQNTHVKDYDVECDVCLNRIKLTTKQRKALRRKDFINMVKESAKSCFQFTGVPSVDLLKKIFEWLEVASKKLKLWDGKMKLSTTGKSRGRKRSALSLFEEYVLTLVRIRRGYDVVFLAYRFGVTTSHVVRVVTAWINFLAKCFKPLIKWPSTDMVKGNLPTTFKAFPRTKVIIDCTEIYVEKAFRPSAQKSTWSSYKHANTFKLLVGIMPSGAITFMSKLYSGCISDQNIVEKSGFLDKIQAGDDVMADRGFNIRHLLLPRGATLNIPSFSHGKRLSKKAVTRSRKIASVRIHVERAIRRMKTFRILSGIIPIRLRFQLDQIITIVAVLCNLQRKLA